MEGAVRAQHNAEYIKMLDCSLDQIEHGEVVTKSMEELQAME
jgi:hypothetical protein